ncbi:hypothetical protein [Aquabacterium humicola]|uniref:hypothetical protein n=1 Tax=Aquabacterium humicola TaxID=3237377 RepID=UPI002542D303|nr:hypothetical protein [Rubrivivax pictus]
MRNFGITPEHKGLRAKPRKALSFVLQKHWAKADQWQAYFKASQQLMTPLKVMDRNGRT